MKLFRNQGKQFNKHGTLVRDGHFGRDPKCFKGIKYDSDGIKESEGLFVEDKLQGKGILYYDNGSVRYKGELKNDKGFGYGTCYHREGNKKYTGHFRNGKFDDIGEKYDYCGNLICKCLWDNGKVKQFLLSDEQHLSGFQVKEHEIFVYIGEVKNAEPHGIGSQYHPENGAKYFDGNFTAGKKHGLIKSYHVKNPDHPNPSYLCYYKNNQQNGYGADYWPNGKMQRRGRYRNHSYDSNKFYIWYKKNGEIDFGNSRFLGKLDIMIQQAEALNLDLN